MGVSNGGLQIGQISPCVNAWLGPSDVSGGGSAAPPDPQACANEDASTADYTGMNFCSANIRHPFPADLLADKSTLDDYASVAYDTLVDATTGNATALSTTCLSAVHEALCLDRFPTCDCNYQSHCYSTCNHLNACLKAKGTGIRVSAQCDMDCDSMCQCDPTPPSPPLPDSGSYSYGASPDEGTDEDTDEGFCFIATAAYGTELHPNLYLLRQYRDLVLPRPFVLWYYRVSPPVAKWIASRPAARLAVRAALAPIVTVLWMARQIDTTYALAKWITIMVMMTAPCSLLIVCMMAHRRARRQTLKLD